MSQNNEPANESDPWGSDPFASQPTQKAITSDPWPEPKSNDQSEPAFSPANENPDPWATTYDPFSNQPAGGAATYDEVPWDNDLFAGQTYDSVPSEQQTYDSVPNDPVYETIPFNERSVDGQTGSNSAWAELVKTESQYLEQLEFVHKTFAPALRQYGAQNMMGNWEKLVEQSQLLGGISK